MRFFDQNLESTVLQRASLEKDLRHGIANGELQLHYQPQWNSGGAIVGAEALVRWQSPSRGLVQPGDFISMAEETGLILPLGHSVMECACAQLASWAKDESTAHLTIAVNVSVRQFQQAGFETEILTLIESAHADPRKLKLELTESVLLTDVESVIAKMKMLNARGLTFSLDDFGTGYSSLSYLRSLPLSQLKIDRSFVNCLLDDSNCATIVRSIIALAQSFGLEVIAEGVETEEQRAVLDQLGCQTYQGYLLSKPLPVEDFLGFIRRHGCPK